MKAFPLVAYAGVLDEVRRGAKGMKVAALAIYHFLRINSGLLAIN
jgi:hypothetical protein